jgi:hypothetical protein
MERAAIYMKKNFNYRMAGLGTGLLLIGLSASAQPFSNPTGTLWDCNMSGSRNGLAVIAFDDTNFTMTEIIVPKKVLADRGDSRGRIDSRTGLPADTKFTSTNLFGGGTITGPWNIDANGHIIGFFIEASDKLTNQFSFAGTMVPGKRLTLNVQSTVGNMVYRGKPLTTLNDYSGQFYGVVSQSQRKYLDFFTLSNRGSGAFSVDASDNTYSLDGAGPGYSYNSANSFAMISAWKKVAYVAQFVEDTNMVRAVVGSFNLNSAKGNTTGLQQVPNVQTNRASFNTFMIQSVSN